MTVRVAITGTLSGIKRNEAVKLIQATGAEFTREVNYKTNYLVTTRFDTAKAKKAIEIGVQLLSESELFDFLEIGNFPENQKPVLPERIYTNNFPKPVWLDLASPVSARFSYVDPYGEFTDREVKLLAIGKAKLSSGREQTYISAYDLADERTKSFRLDRIVKLPPEIEMLL